LANPLFLNIYSLDRFYADGKRRKVKAAGLGDVSGIANIWLRRPSRESSGNVAFGLGLKIASGDNGIVDNFFLADGSVTKYPVDQSIQLGDGGVGIVFQLQAYRKIAGATSGYVYGWYLLTPREKTAVSSPLAGVPVSVPDVYSFRSGISAAVWPRHGISASFGPRIDGIPLTGFCRRQQRLPQTWIQSLSRSRSRCDRRAQYLECQRAVARPPGFPEEPADIDRGSAGGGDLTDTWS
jgi:hypothetical protein